MIIRYNKMSDEERRVVRSFESRGHAGYIRYLMMRKVPIARFNKELLQLGLSGFDESEYFLYFEKVLYPIIQRYGLKTYYKVYMRSGKDEILDFLESFGRSEKERIAFCQCAKEMEIEYFFAEEIRDYFGIENIPVDDNGEFVVTRDRMPDWTELLNHEKRPLIDGMLADGFSPGMIERHLDEMYDIQLASSVISMYAKAFMQTKRKDLEHTIDELNLEKEKLESQLNYVRKNADRTITIGEKTVIVSTLRKKIDEIQDRINRIRGHHGHAAFSQGVLEYTNIREIFSDVMIRTHRRYKTMDERTEDGVVAPLSQLVNMMTKATDKIITIDATIKDSSSKSIADEMLEVVLPTLDRIEEEEAQARQEYLDTYSISNEEDGEEILGEEE